MKIKNLTKYLRNCRSSPLIIIRLRGGLSPSRYRTLLASLSWHSVSREPVVPVQAPGELWTRRRLSKFLFERKKEAGSRTTRRWRSRGRIKRVIGVQTETIRKVDADVPLLGFAAASPRDVQSSHFYRLWDLIFLPGNGTKPFLFSYLFFFFFSYIYPWNWKNWNPNFWIFVERMLWRSHNAKIFSICAIEILFKICENGWRSLKSCSKARLIRMR